MTGLIIGLGSITHCVGGKRIALFVLLFLFVVGQFTIDLFELTNISMHKNLYRSARFIKILNVYWHLKLKHL